MSADLRHARVYVSMLAAGEAREQAMAALKAAGGFIRRRLGQTLRLRYTPEVVFDLDTSIEYGARIDSLIEETRAGSARPEEPVEDPPEPAEGPPEPKT